MTDFQYVNRAADLTVSDWKPHDPWDLRYTVDAGYEDRDQQLEDYLSGLAKSGIGKVFYAQVTADQGGITTIAFLTGLATTNVWRASPDRRYRITAKVEVTQTTAADVWVLKLIDQSVPVQLQRSVGQNNTTSSCTGHLAYVTTTSLSGLKDYRLTLERVGAGTLTMSAGSAQPAFLLIEDIGALT